VTRSFVFTPKPSRTRGDLGHRADEDSEWAADRLLARIYDECQKVGDMPGMGHYREDFTRPELQVLGRSLVPDRVRWEVRPIQVVAVVHGARNLSSFFRKRVR
jgi:plasmid stabilization system protein ParE